MNACCSAVCRACSLVSIISGGNGLLHRFQLLMQVLSEIMVKLGALIVTSHYNHPGISLTHLTGPSPCLLADHCWGGN